MSKEGYYQGEFEYAILTGRPPVWFDPKSKRWKSAFSQKFIPKSVAKNIISETSWTFEELKSMDDEDWRIQKEKDLNFSTQVRKPS